MESFKYLEIKQSYKTPKDDVISEFLVPVLEKSVNYDRSVAFFTSDSLTFLYEGLINLINLKGKIRLIISPQLNVEDIEIINKGYADRTSINDLILEKTEFKIDDKNSQTTSYNKLNNSILYNLIKNNILDVKISFSKSKVKIALFHEKIGIAYDKNNDVIVFSGSMNDSKSAYYYNYETIDIFTSWKDENRVLEKIKSFNDLWDRKDDNALVLDFSENLSVILKRKGASEINDEELFEQIREITNINFEVAQKIGIPDEIKLYSYQIEAIENWEKQNFQGIFDMATGTGKTITAISAAANLYKNKKKLAVVVVCPYIHLIDQWSEDLTRFGFKPIEVYHQNENYLSYIINSVYEYRNKITDNLCIVVSNASYGKIKNMLDPLNSEMLLIIDEAHNFGAENLQNLLDESISYRIALSATIERFNDDDGTKKIIDYFGKKAIVFGLDKAIENNFLTEYYYYPVISTFSENELKLYKKISTEIAQCFIGEGVNKKLSEKGKILAQKRSRLVAGISSKITVLENLIKDFKNDNHILIYCGATKLTDEDDSGFDQKQIDVVSEMIWKKHRIKYARFTSEEDNKTRSKIKRDFAEGENIQALVAIRCLDEGVNIPEIEKVFILASSTNPKEYIQRRGRVLRKSKGKKHAIIYDFITLPRDFDKYENISQTTLDSEKSLIRHEIKRIEEFYKLAKNKEESVNIIYELTKIYGQLDQKSSENYD